MEDWLALIDKADQGPSRSLATLAKPSKIVSLFLASTEQLRLSYTFQDFQVKNSQNRTVTLDWVERMVW